MQWTKNIITEQGQSLASRLTATHGASSLEPVQKHVLTEYGCSQARGLVRSMETMLLQPILLTLLGRGDGGAVASPTRYKHRRSYQ